MTKSASRKKGGRLPRADRPAIPDRAFYVSFVLVTAFIAFLAMITIDPGAWRYALIICAACFVITANYYAWQTCRGARLSGLKAALARVPLRPAGYGTRHGRPIGAAHDRPEAKQALAVSAIVSVVLLGALGAVLFVWLG